MALQNVQTKEMSLVLSSDAKPRLKWTPELHQRFVDAVDQLGGPEKATPKSLMRVMGVHGLTLYHLKSHLQKYRLGRSQLPQTYHQYKEEDIEENQRIQPTTKNDNEGQKQINESLQIAQALQIQVEVQRKLHEQIEVQRHLQLRIEAQGKYLQSVLKKAQETLSGHSSCSIEVERARAQLSELVSMVDSACPSSSFSVLTECEGSMWRDKQLANNRNSLESSLTSSESSRRKEEIELKHASNETYQKTWLSLMEMHPAEGGGSEDQAPDRKQGKSAIDAVETNSQNGKRLRLLENIDLNCKTMNDFD